MEEIPAGGCSYVCMVGDFSFGLLSEDKKLLVIQFAMSTQRMAGLGECDVGPLHPEDEEFYTKIFPGDVFWRHVVAIT